MNTETTWEDERAELVRLSRKHELDNHHNAALCPYCTPRKDAIDVVHLARQAAWSAQTFGPGSRGGGVSDHIRKELDTEVREGQPDEDPLEWIDVIILAFDGAWRSGLSPQEIIDGVKAKQARNEARTWPDWRTAEPGKAIEHDRTGEPTTAPDAAGEPAPLCRDELHIEQEVPYTDGFVDRFPVTLYCHQPAGHDPGAEDGGHRNRDGDEW